MRVPKWRKKHPQCPGCECWEKPKPVPEESDWQPGGRVVARKKKSRVKYSFKLTLQYQKLLDLLFAETTADGKRSVADHNIVFDFGLRHHQMGAQRARLRDAGVVDYVGNTVINGMTHDLWALNAEGRRVWEPHARSRHKM